MHCFRYFIILIFFLLTVGSVSGAFQEADTSSGFIYVDGGRLYHPDSSEVSLWGVNIQPMLSWEYNGIMKKVGIPKNAAVWKEIVDETLDELEIMNCKVWRAHLTPADFTNSTGGLVQTIYLDLLDYTTAEAAKRGIYAFITFLNHMFNAEVQQSFMQTSFLEARQISEEDDKRIHRNMLMFDPDYLAYSQNYIRNLLNRINPYTGISYSNDTSIVVWEIMNEPTYLDYEKIKLYTEEYGNYQAWLTDQGLSEQNGIHYPAYRKMRVLEYINGMYDLVKNEGGQQPVAWNCNWHRMINGNEDVFEAIAESKMEVISFCNYPGQDMTTNPFWNNPIELTQVNFSGWYRKCYENQDWYGWALEPRFANKAKVVYEFETFYNQSAYLYAVMADFLRAVGVQVATMWHYSMPAYAPWRNGSHILNLKCTPRKAASFIVASKIFEGTPILQGYNVNSTTERTTQHYMYSFDKNLCIWSSEEEYIYSGTLPGPESPAPDTQVKHILGYGSSSIVKYCGSGIYDIRIEDSEIRIHIEPNSGWLRPPWGQDKNKYIVTELDYERAYTMELRLEGWDPVDCDLMRLENSSWEQIQFIGDKLRFPAKPGDYKIHLK